MDAIDSVEVAIICALIVDAFKVDPVSVEKVVNDNPGAFILVALSVDTVSVDVTASVLVEMVDAFKVDPVSVENDVNDNPGAFILVAVSVDTVIVDAIDNVLAEMVDPRMVELFTSTLLIELRVVIVEAFNVETVSKIPVMVLNVPLPN